MGHKFTTSADLSVFVGVAEVVLCSEDHTPKESQQRYVICVSTHNDTGIRYGIMGNQLWMFPLQAVA